MPALKRQKQRTGTQSLVAAKKPKLSNAPSKSQKAKGKGKEHAYDRDFIPIPKTREQNEDDSDASEQDLETLREIGSAGQFLRELDERAISRSKVEIQRLHRLSKPARKPVENDDDLPSVNSHSELGDDWSSDIGSSSGGSSAHVSDEEASSDWEGSSPSGKHSLNSDVEMPYEVAPRLPRRYQQPQEEKGIHRLPIKLPDGRIQHSNVKIVSKADFSEEDSEESENEEPDLVADSGPTVEDVSTGARFGRPAVVDVVGIKSRKARIEGAKGQIANICQEIVSDPENSLGLLRRLHTFSLANITTPSHPEPVTNDPLIRKMTILSQLAVFIDILPGYRIRPLTDLEKSEKVSQAVQRTREYEQGLVSVYQAYLLELDAQLKSKGELASVALKCICRLLVDATHFNFRTNLMSSIISQLSRRSWTDASDLCLQSIIAVFRADNTGQASLELVRLLNRMIKERRFQVHPNVMSCLLHLRLQTELGGIRASLTSAERDSSTTQGPKMMSKTRQAARRAKGKTTAQPHLSKKARKTDKELREIREEMKEAEAEVDRDERANMQTETLKLLFVLYFRILKNTEPTVLLPAALAGISRFAHLVNVDFFTDLMHVLKGLVGTERVAESQDEPQGTERTTEKGSDQTHRSKDQSNNDLDPEAPGVNQAQRRHLDSAHIQHRLLCIITAFELLTGQGEALNIDLHDFVDRLYELILPLSLLSDIEDAIVGMGMGMGDAVGVGRAVPSSAPAPDSKKKSASKGAQSQLKQPTTASLFFRALQLVFSSPSSALTSSSSSQGQQRRRAAAFGKRLLTASLHFPPNTAVRALAFVRDTFIKPFSSGSNGSGGSGLDAMIPASDEAREVQNESGVGAGVLPARVLLRKYYPEVDDPQLCGAVDGTVFWELATLARSHSDSRVRKVAAELLRQK